METNMTDPDAGTDGGDSPDEQPEFHVESMRVHGDGKVTIPARLRDIYDIEHLDVVNIIVYPAGRAFQATDIGVQSDGRITIPERKRDLYGIQDGDTVDMTVQLTDMTYPADE